MIIKLKGADFSSNNINSLLNSWLISIKNGNCVTAADNISSVEKGESYNNTFTIKENFEVTGVEVTMGGEVLPNVTSNNGNQITINISSVTGAVSIAFTYNYNGGTVEPEPEDPETGNVVDITDQFNLQPNYMIAQCTSVGTYQSYNGSWVANENYVDISNYSEIEIKMSKTSATGTNTGITFYNTDKTVVAGYAHTLGDSEYGVMVRTFKRVANPATDQTIAQEVIEIPETAVYVRTTYWNTATGTANYDSSFGEFYCKATPKA